MWVEAVLFDLFDTLLLLQGGDAFYEPSLKKLHEFLVENGINVSFGNFKRVYFEVRDELYAEVEQSLEEPHFNVRVSRTLQRLGYDFDVSSLIVTKSTSVFADEFTRYLRLDDDALPVLQKLRGKYKLGLVSNFAIPECAWELLDKYGLRGFFDAILISAEINKRKPSPEIFEKALQILDVSASKAVFVGDVPSSDVKGAKNAGMKAILVDRGRPTEKAIDVKPDEVVSSLKELLITIEDC